MSYFYSQPHCVMTLSLALFACSPEAAQPPTLESTVQMTPTSENITAITPKQPKEQYILTAEDKAFVTQEVLTIITAMVDVLTEKKTPQQVTAPDALIGDRTPEQDRAIKAAILGKGEFTAPKNPRKPAVSFRFMTEKEAKVFKEIVVRIRGSFKRRDGNSPFSVATANVDIPADGVFGIDVDPSFYTKTLGLKFVRRFHESELTEFEQRARYFDKEKASQMTAADLRAYFAEEPAYYTFEKPSETGVLLFEFIADSDELKYPDYIYSFKIIHKIKPTPIGTKCATNDFCPQSGIWEISWSKEALEQKDFILPNERREFKRGDTFPVPTVQVRQHTFLSRLDVFELYFLPKWVAYPGRSANWKLVSYL